MLRDFAGELRGRVEELTHIAHRANPALDGLAIRHVDGQTQVRDPDVACQKTHAHMFNTHTHGQHNTHTPTDPPQAASCVCVCEEGGEGEVKRSESQQRRCELKRQRLHLPVNPPHGRLCGYLIGLQRRLHWGLQWGHTLDGQIGRASCRERV